MDYKFLSIVVLSALVLLFVLLTIIFAVKNKKSKQQNIDLINHNLEQIEELYKYKEVELERRYEERRTQLVNQYDELKEQKETEFNQAREKLDYLKESHYTYIGVEKEVYCFQLKYFQTHHRLLFLQHSNCRQELYYLK